MLARGKTTIYGYHPTRYGYRDETHLMIIPNEHMDMDADLYRGRLAEDGFTITREVRTD